MRHYLCFVLWMLCFYPTLWAQEIPAISTDSLATLLETSRDYYYRYDYVNSIQANTQLIDEAKRAKNPYYAFRAYIELGHTYSYVLKDSIKGRINYENALKQAQLSGTDSLIAWAYSAFGNLYAETGVYYDKAITYYKKSIAINEKSPKGEVKNLVEYMNIGWTYIDLKEPDKAYTYLIKTKQLAQVEKQSILLHLNLQVLFGRYYLLKGKNNLAIKELKEVATVSEERDFVIQAAEANRYLAEAYKLEGDYRNANESLLKQIAYDKRVFDKDKVSALEEASAKFVLQQYQSDLEIAQKEREYNAAIAEKSRFLAYIFIGSFVGLLFAFIVIYRLSKTRKRYINRLFHKNLELTQAKEEAEKLSTLKTQFFSTISHELRTPLYGVIGISSILMEDQKLKEHQDDLKSLKFSADYLLALINDVLTLNKMDANGVKLERTPFSLRRLLNNIVRTFSFSLEQNNNQIELSIDEAIPDQLVGDSVRLSQILMNLVGNAVKFNEGGTIWIAIESLDCSMDRTHYSLRFMVRDDGIGIPKENQATIFEEFSQVENKNYSYQGTGLGLPIVKKLLALHGSEIHLDSELGKGATFSFELTYEVSENTYQAPELASPFKDIFQYENTFENIHILVVDDNRINQKITQKILEQRLFNCSLADHGEEAIQKVKLQRFDVILMDIHMPGMDGIQATQHIRAFDKVTPIIALTAVEIDEMRKKIMEAGMNDIILKPYDVSQFLNTILRNLNPVYTKQV
ncbi:MAG: response regulator [Flavobacteriaceae bacterium]